MRQCGGCTTCCTIPRVPELNKPVNLTCLYCNKGCRIYRRRPQSCRDFQCEWLRGEMREWMRPDKCHVMIERVPGKNIVLALPEPGHERTWRTPNVVRQLVKYFLRHGIAVVAADLKALIPKEQSAEQVVREVKEYARSVGAI